MASVSVCQLLLNRFFHLINFVIFNAAVRSILLLNKSKLNFKINRVFENENS